MKSDMKKENIVKDKSLSFAIRIVNLYKYLVAEKRETVMSKQLLRCGTSIGANVSEAVKAQSTADFHTKLTIALKEANETGKWLEMLFKSDYIDETTFSL